MLNTGARVPFSASCTKTALPRGPASTAPPGAPDTAASSSGRASSLKPCSSPFGSLAYHSSIAPRAYSIRFPDGRSAAAGTGHTRFPRPYPTRSSPHSHKGSSSVLGITRIPASVK